MDLLVGTTQKLAGELSAKLTPTRFNKKPFAKHWECHSGVYRLEYTDYFPDSFAEKITLHKVGQDLPLVNVSAPSPAFSVTVLDAQLEDFKERYARVPAKPINRLHERVSVLLARQLEHAQMLCPNTKQGVQLFECPLTYADVSDLTLPFLTYFLS